MFKSFVVAVVVCAAGCQSPAADYVQAEAKAWAIFDKGGRLDHWIDLDATLSADDKDAMHQLNVARRARVAHAIAAVGS